MHLPEAARDSNTKATENVVRILKAGTKYPLDEYGFQEHGRESKCYVPVSRGDQLAVKFTLKSGQLEFVDLLVDGILRWSSYNKLATLRHSRTIFEVCHCTQGRRKGKLQISEMVVKNRTNWAGQSPTLFSQILLQLLCTNSRYRDSAIFFQFCCIFDCWYP